jgi:hypothetical protein
LDLEELMTVEELFRIRKDEPKFPNNNSRNGEPSGKLCRSGFIRERAGIYGFVFRFWFGRFLFPITP